MNCTRITVFFFAWGFIFLTSANIGRAENATQLPTTTITNIIDGKFGVAGVTKTSTTSITKVSQIEDTTEKTYNVSVECNSVTEKEKLYAVRFEISTRNITVSEWKRTYDEIFRRKIAAELTSSCNSSTLSISSSDIMHVEPSPAVIKNNTLHVAIFLEEGKINLVNKALDEEQEGSGDETQSYKGYEIMRNATAEAGESLAYDIAITDIKSGLNCQTANSLFYDYFELWIALIAVASLLILVTALFTWYCCRRRVKSVHLKTKAAGLPSTDELKMENGGLDNPAMTLTVEESPEKKKKTQAPSPPPAPDMTTFGKGETGNNDKESQYDTGIVPYDTATDSPSEGEKHRPQDMEMQDTKL